MGQGWFVWFIWLIWFIWLVSCNQKTRQTRQAKQRSSYAGGLFQHPARARIAIVKKAVIAYDHLIAGAWR
jgi:hypothetical protein